MSKFESRYDQFLSLGSWLNALFYGLPAVGLLAVMSVAGVNSNWWTPVLLAYGIAAVAHLLNYGHMAINLQMKVISDYWEHKLDKQRAAP